MLESSKPEPLLSDGRGGTLIPRLIYLLMRNCNTLPGQAVRYAGGGYFHDEQGMVIDADYDWLLFVNL